MTPALVIVEGTCGAGKTTLLRAAQSMIPDREVRLFTQRETYGAIAHLEDEGTLDNEGNLRSLSAIVDEIRDAVVGTERLVLVDTLHATHFVRAGALKLASFEEIDRRLAQLNALVVVLRVSEPTIRARTIIGRRNTGFYGYARKFGTDEDQRVAYFAREQERLIELLHRHSQLRQVALDAEHSVERLNNDLCAAVTEHLYRR